MQIERHIRRTAVSNVAPVDERPSEVVGNASFRGSCEHRIDVPACSGKEVDEQRAVARELPIVEASRHPLGRIGREVARISRTDSGDQPIGASSLSRLHKGSSREAEVSIGDGCDIEGDRRHVTRPLPSLTRGAIDECILRAGSHRLHARLPDPVEQGVAGLEGPDGLAKVGALQKRLADELDGPGRPHMDLDESAPLRSERHELLHAASSDVMIQIAGRRSAQGDPWLDPALRKALAHGYLDDCPGR